jgi:hypothetical protein
MKIILCEKQFIFEHNSCGKEVLAKDIIDSTIMSWNLNGIRVTTIRLTNREYIGKLDCLKLNLKIPDATNSYIFYCHSESECCVEVSDDHNSILFQSQRVRFKKVKNLSVGDKILADPIMAPGGPLEFVSYEEIGELDAWSYDVIYDEEKSVLVCSFCTEDKGSGLSLR